MQETAVDRVRFLQDPWEYFAINILPKLLGLYTLQGDDFEHFQNNLDNFEQISTLERDEPI